MAASDQRAGFQSTEDRQNDTGESQMTEARTYTFDDMKKAEWGDGPWLSEPDKIVWVDEASGLDCLIVRNNVGSLCGYVGVPEGHPWHGKDYDNVEPYPEVHGGLTFAGPCQEGKEEREHAICHSPIGRPDNVWWLGFDTAHCWDLSPSMRRYGTATPGDVYRDRAYVEAEIANLVAQAVAAT